MAHATIEGRKHLIRVTRDLTESFAVELYPEPVPGKVKTAEPYKPWPVPLTMKVKADTAEDALVCVLEHLKKLGRISAFHVDENERPKPPPPPPAKPAAAPAAAAPMPAPVAKPAAVAAATPPPAAAAPTVPAAGKPPAATAAATPPPAAASPVAPAAEKPAVAAPAEPSTPKPSGS